MADPVLSSALPDALQRAEDLPSMPAVAVEVLRLTQDDDSTLDDLAEVLSMDPALSTKLLKLSNSPLFNLGAEVTTLQRACLVLGLKTVKLMSLSFSLVSSLQSKQSGPFDYQEYWRRSVVRAVAGRTLAQDMRSSLADEAFLCGLLGSLGQLVLARCMPEEYEAVLELAGAAWPTSELEERQLGFSGTDVGGALLAQWELPELICLCVSHMHDPSGLPHDASPDVRELTRVMHLAQLCEELLCGVEPGAAKARLEEAAARQYELTPEDVEPFVVGLQVNVEAAAEMLNTDVGHLDIAEILQRAQAELVKASLGVVTESRALENERSALASRNEELRSKAHTDALTGLPNRAAFDELLESCVQDRLRGRVPKALGLLILDVDRFKAFNDTYGHQTGDDVLRIVGAALDQVTRDSDFAARYGGEEFCVVMPRTTSFGMKSLAERIRATIEAATLDVGGETLSVTVSAGGACTTRVVDESDGASLLKIADHYLYKAKQSGRNRCEFYPKLDLPR